MFQVSDKKDCEMLEKSSSFHSVTTNFVSVTDDSRMRLIGSTSSLKAATSSAVKKRFSLPSPTPKSRTPSPEQRKPSPRKKSSPCWKIDVEFKKIKKAQTPFQKKLQDPTKTWHHVLAQNIAAEPSFNTKYGVDENNKNLRIKEYKPKLPLTPRYPRSNTFTKPDKVGDGTGGDSKLHSRTTEECEVKEKTLKHASRSRTTSRDPLVPLPHRSPTNKFSISKKKKGSDGVANLETISNISELLSCGESESSKPFPKSASEISSFMEAGK